MSRIPLVPLVLAAVAALPVPAPAQQQPDQVLRKLYDAPLKKLYNDPMRKYDADPMRKYFPNANPQAVKPPDIYPDNPLIPGGQPRAPRTFNALPKSATTTPPTSQPPADSRFRNMDTNNDGRVSRQEYMNSNMARAPVHPSVGDLRSDSLRQRFDSRFGAADTNHDGQITPNEYNAVTNPRF